MSLYAHPTSTLGAHGVCLEEEASFSAKNVETILVMLTKQTTDWEDWILLPLHGMGYLTAVECMTSRYVLYCLHPAWNLMPSSDAICICICGLPYFYLLSLMVDCFQVVSHTLHVFFLFDYGYNE